MQTETIIRIAELFSKHRELRLSTISTYAVNDGKWLKDLKGGSGCTLRKASIFMSWISDNWPVDLEWPADIARPTPAVTRRRAS